MISVVCVYWGNKFPVEYVYNLKSMVQRNTTVAHEFVCFSDRQIPNVKTKILDKGLEGWWNKLQMFNTKFGLNRDVVYFDLDTLITDNIDWLMNYDTIFMGIEDLGSINKHQPHLIGKFQSGVMKWNYPMGNTIWQTFSKNLHTMQVYRGDGELLNDFVPKERRELLQRVFPGKLKSYKYQVYNEGLQDASIVCFHGRPSILQAMSETIKTPRAIFKPQDWIKEIWR
jgi:hypothetical protein